MCDGDSTEESALVQEHGNLVFAKYMEILSEGPEVFQMTTKCFGPTHGQKESQCASVFFFLGNPQKIKSQD